MDNFDIKNLQKLYVPPSDSHKGQNGKLLLIGGSHLFHAASLWALQIASRIVDMVFYSSVPENNRLVQKAKEEFRNGIVVRREHLDEYIQEANCILIGPGMLRSQHKVQSSKFKVQSLSEINKMEDEGEQTYFLTKYLLAKYPDKKWVIDAGALQMMDPEWLKQLNGNAVITPHRQEFESLFSNVILEGASATDRILSGDPIASPSTGLHLASLQDDIVGKMAKEYNCIILLKGEKDLVCSPTQCVEVSGGNAGMTKGGTGDVLSGLVAALACKNDLFLSAMAGSFINKKAGERLAQRVGFYFNASDLVNEIPMTMKELL